MRIPLAALFAFLLIAVPASAQGIATATPNQAGKGTKLHTEIDATQPPINSRIPTSTTISIQSGYTFDPRAVAKRCTTEQAQVDKCPPKSSVGTAVITASAFSMTLDLPLRLYLMKPQQPGDLAGVAAVTNVLGSTYATIGRVVSTTIEPFGIQVILPTSGDLSAFNAEFKSFKSDIAASRTVKITKGKGKKKHKVKKTYFLVRNPATCPTTAAWASRSSFTFSDGSTADIDLPIACVG